MSNRASDIYKNKWSKVAKLITSLSKSIRHYIDNADPEDIPDHETLLISVQLLSLICGGGWDKSIDKMDELWAVSKQVHKLVKASVESADTGNAQTYISDAKKMLN